MTTEPLIIVKNVYLHIPIFKPSDRKLSVNPIRILGDFYRNKSSREIKTLLSDINFQLNQGDRVGVLGSNGAGKSTLLRLLSGVYRNSSGTITVKGSSHGMFEVNQGMDREATGMENIYLRGLQMGLSLPEIKDSVSSVVEFSDIGSAMNDVYSGYSTGMQLRLAMGISTMVRPDILIMDEWVGSGDKDFKKKVDIRMTSLIDEAGGLVIASHSSPLLSRVCNRGIVMRDGFIVFDGLIDDAVDYYHSGTA